MEYRKLISFGKSSFVVSLPKSWVTQNKMKKGDLVYFEDSGVNLLLNPRKNDNEIVDKEIIINIDGKNPSLLKREICSYYILNYRKLVLHGKEIRSKIKEIQQLIQSFIALEIMEQTSDTIIAKDFLSMEKVSINELVKKMDIITRTMFKEACESFHEDNYDNINERDQDINRLYFLLYRAVVYNLENPFQAVKNHRLSPLEIFKYYQLGFYIEIVADEVRRSTRFARKLQVSPAKRIYLERLLQRINEYYLNTMKATYSNDFNAVLKLSEEQYILNKEFDALEPEVIKIEYLGRFIGHLRRMSMTIHNIGRVAYTLT